MNEFSAAIGIEQLKKLNKTNSRRKEIAKRYSKELEIEEKMPFDKNCSFHFYWIQVKNRKKFMKNWSFHPSLSSSISIDLLSWVFISLVPATK